MKVFGWHTGDAELSSPRAVAEPDAMLNSETNPEQPQNTIASQCTTLEIERAGGQSKQQSPAEEYPHAVRICEI